ncbi:CoA pyrophosphatase [Cutibacterium equinum]|uniref:CoA pyrophosphatase n=1 Tax=Cutibacterium equinum TaxID=3016342 RepID=A0ABY7R056_9ACTN|nr:CoA pyrophosphatase [Cutibacterium equinum]WCC80164.1 CoA pyrophosphatase [Cutibacterium equinum]
MSHLNTLIASLGREDPNFSVGRRPRGGRSSAVLALVSETDHDIVLTRRPLFLRHHAGQVALPGGRTEEADNTIVDTALREAQEEVGLDRDLVTVRGILPTAHVAASQSDVTTVVATWEGKGAVGVVDPGEVALVQRVRLADLANPAARAMTRHPSGYRGPAFVLPDLFVWGFTAHVLDSLLERGGWARPWDRERIVEIPEGYLGARRLPEGTAPDDIP